MKNIKFFKYKSTTKFTNFLNDYRRKPEDVVGFSLDDQKHCCGNTFKEYCVYFSDGAHGFFRVVIFKSFHEYHQARLGFKGNKLFDWFEEADIREHK